MALTCAGLDCCEVPHLMDPQQLACPKSAGQESTAQHASREEVPEVQTVTQVPCGGTGLGSDICRTALPSRPAVRKHLRFSLSLRCSDGAYVGAGNICREQLVTDTVPSTRPTSGLQGFGC